MTKPSSQNGKGPFDVALSRRINASPEDIFAAWTEPDRFAQWFDTKKTILNVRVGGLYFSQGVYEGGTWALYGRYLRIERPHLLEKTFMSLGTQGKETLVKVELTADESGTELRLTHAGLPDEESRQEHEAGWIELLERLTQYARRR